MALTFENFSSGEQAEQALYNEIRRYVTTGNGSHDKASPFVLMLPGGSTPQRIFERIVQSPPPSIHPQLVVMLSDDRHVPYDAPESNYGHLAPALEAMHLPEDRQIMIPYAGTNEQDAEHYGRRIQKLIDADATFALAVLGVGPDGHTASLFETRDVELGAKGSPLSAGEPPRAPLTSSPSSSPMPSSPWTIARTGPNGIPRVSVTASVLLRFKRLLFFATGESKRQILYDLSRNPEDYPAGRVAVQHPDASFWTDVAPEDL